jgi:chromate transporter
MLGINAPQRPAIATLTLLLARDANWTLGGGTATSEVLRRSLVRRGWITDADHQRLYAISRVTPGTNLLAYCTAIGWHIRGATGALACWLAASVPCSLIALAVTVLYDRLETARAFALLITAGMSVAVVLLGASAWHLARPHLAHGNRWRSAAVLVLVITLFAFDVSPIQVMLLAAALGALWPVRA